MEEIYQLNLNEEFHERRVGFMILNGKIIFLENNKNSHYFWAKELGIKRDEFEQLVRGYYLNNRIIFYKGNFSYDNECINAAKNYSKQIKEFCKAGQTEVWCGVKVGNSDAIWDLSSTCRPSNIRRAVPRFAHLLPKHKKIRQTSQNAFFLISLSLLKGWYCPF